jgi:SHS2 domain-containing protein
VQEKSFVPAGAELRIRVDGEKALSLEARLLGVPLDLEGQGWQGEIKSATFHGLHVTPGNDGWQTRVILDV